MNTDNRLLAVWGGSGAGKTTTAVKLAMELASHKKNVVILMCNFTTPAPQTLLPNISTDGKSLENFSACHPFHRKRYSAGASPSGKALI